MPKFRRQKLGRPRRIGRIILIILLVIVLGSLGLFFYYDSNLHRVDALPEGRPMGARLRSVRWLLEEYRVSLFAQQLGTAEPVSLQRITKALAATT